MTPCCKRLSWLATLAFLHACGNEVDGDSDALRDDIVLPSVDISFEESLEGWGADTAERLRVEDAPHGAYVVRIPASTGSVLADDGPTVSETRGGAPYHASIWVRAANEQAVSTAVRLRWRESTAEGAMVDDWSSDAILVGSDYAEVRVTAVPVADGEMLDLDVMADAVTAGALLDFDILHYEGALEPSAPMLEEELPLEGLVFANASAQPVWVDDDGAQARAAGITKWYTTINAGIAAASAGSVVAVLPGRYNGAVTITKSLALRAMKNAREPVNPTHSPDNDEWPVIVESPSNGIALVGIDNVSIEGFYVRKSGFNGIHVMMGGGADNFRDLCENIYILGNRIENVPEDGIKANQCNRLYIAGNRISKFSNDPINAGEKEHGIDFVAVANSVVRNNVISDGGVGTCLKGGSINVLYENNKLLQPLRWVGLSSGEPSTAHWMFQSSRQKYQAKHITVRNNTFETGFTFWSCQGCTAIDNDSTSAKVTQRSPEKSLDVCIQNSGRVELLEGVAQSEVTTSSCPTNWSSGVKAQTSVGWDVRAGGPVGGFLPAPAPVTPQTPPVTPPQAAPPAVGDDLKVKPVHSGMCLDIYGASQENGAMAMQFDCYERTNQRFRLVAKGSGTYAIVNKRSGKCLDVQARSIANGARVQQWDCTGGTNQTFTLRAASNGAWRIVAQHSDKCVGISGGALAKNASLIQWSCVQAADQTFTLAE